MSGRWRTGLGLIAWVATLPLLVLATALLRQSDVAGDQSLTLRMDRLVLAKGVGAVVDGAFQISALDDDGTALVAARLDAPLAPDFAYVAYQVENVPLNVDLVFFWRTQARPDRLRFLTLYPPASGSDRRRLSDHRPWRGQLIEAGLALFPKPQVAPALPLSGPVIVRQLELRGESLGDSVRALFSDWRAFRSWTLASTHWVGGDRRDYPEPSAVMVAAIWLALGLIMAGLFRARTAAMIMVFAAWLSLDALWVRNLLLQRAATATVYAGLDWSERHDRVFDVALLSFTEAFKATRIAGDDRVFIAAPSRYVGLRAAWHLLPLNVFNHMPGFDRSGETLLRAGDLLMFIETTPDRVGDVLTLGDSRLLVREVWRGDLGRVLQVTGPA